MRRYLRIIGMFVLILLMGFLMGFSIKRNKDRNLYEMEIMFTDDNSPFITHDTVNKLLIQNDDTITSIPKETLVLKEMESRLLQNPMVRDAQVFVTIDGKLGARIEQRNPIARVAGSASYYIDEDGKKMPLSEVYSARVPLITGHSENNFSELTSLLLRIDRDPYMKQLITGLRREASGDVVMILRELDFEILFGKPITIEKKFQNFKAFFQKLIKDNKLTEYRRVDLRFGNQVVATK